MKTLPDMNLNKEIYTLNARDNVILDVAFKDTNSDKIYYEINNFFEMFISSLSKSKVNYQDLKNCLIPRIQRNEIALVFDSTKTKSNYALLALSKLLPLFDRNSCHSILIGDYIGENRHKNTLYSLFQENLIQINETIYQYHNQYFLVYINNLSNEMVSRIEAQLKPNDFFIGYFDMTYSSKLKTYLSGILTSHLIKEKSILILKDTFETSIIEELDSNLFCDYKELGFTCTFIHSMFYDVFLSYKIERSILDGFKDDTNYSLNALSPRIVNLDECEIEIEDKKFEYIISNKIENISRADIGNFSISNLKNLLNSKINNNYIYNLVFLEEWATLKFNILIEVPRKDSNNPMKLIVAFEYKPKDKLLRLITMF